MAHTLPKSTVEKCMTGVKLVGSDTQALAADIATEYTRLVISEANSICKGRGSKGPIKESDLYEALEVLGFSSYVSGVKEEIESSTEEKSLKSKEKKQKLDSKRGALTTEEMIKLQNELLGAKS